MKSSRASSSDNTESINHFGGVCVSIIKGFYDERRVFMLYLYSLIQLTLWYTVVPRYTSALE
jgi:hypothetical protein